MDKQDSITPKRIITDEELKEGTKKIRRAYFNNWYESCKEIYNKERRRKRREANKAGKNNG